MMILYFDPSLQIHRIVGNLLSHDSIALFSAQVHASQLNIIIQILYAAGKEWSSVVNDFYDDDASSYVGDGDDHDSCGDDNDSDDGDSNHDYHCDDEDRDQKDDNCYS